MKWFYFTDSKGKRHYADSRAEAETKRKEIGGGSVIIETDTHPDHQTDTALRHTIGSNHCSSAEVSFMATTSANETNWLRRTEDLVFGLNELVPALQIYHPTRSSLHSQSDKRVLRLKDASELAIAHYAAALKAILPLNQTILLCCAPGSTPNSNRGMIKIIQCISGGILIDGSSVLQTSRERGRKNAGARFNDNELASTVSVHRVHLPENARVLVIDDVVTSGQTLRVCAALLSTAYPNNRISQLAISSTHYESTAVGVADMIGVVSANEALKPLHSPTQQVTAVPREPDRSPRAVPHREDIRANNRSLARNVQTSSKASGNNATHKRTTSSASSDCFVITAIYKGDPDHPNVIRLRKFRDQQIARLPGGRMIIECYKRIGPALAVVVVKAGLDGPIRSILEYSLSKEGSKQ